MPVDKVRVEIYGDKELIRAFDLADDKVRKSGLRAGLRAVGRMWRESAKARVPVLTGSLRRALTFATKVKNSLYGGVGKLWMGPRYNKANGNQDPGVYGLMVQIGTKHMAPQPFMPDVSATQDEALKKLGDEIWKAIAKGRR
jgi:HK97 gp10 family phage protein